MARMGLIGFARAWCAASSVSPHLCIPWQEEFGPLSAQRGARQQMRCQLRKMNMAFAAEDDTYMLSRGTTRQSRHGGSVSWNFLKHVV
jgi:hypothetical protein